MNTRCILFTAGFLLSTPATVYGQSPKGSVEGDVYLVTRGGDTKKGAGLTVVLVGLDKSGNASKIAAPCQAYRNDVEEYRQQQRAVGGTATDSSSLRYIQGRKAQAVDEVRQAIVNSAAASAKTGMNAHYRFSAVRAGSYALWTEMSLGEYEYAWLVPVTVRAGEALSIDLDNERESSDSIYCGEES